jgi:hypothetical protein
MFGGAVASAINAAVPAFSKTETFEPGRVEQPSAGRKALVALLSTLLILAITLIVGKWLWNAVLVVLVPAVKPAASVWQILGLAILVSLMAPGSTCIV